MLCDWEKFNWSITISNIDVELESFRFPNKFGGKKDQSRQYQNQQTFIKTRQKDNTEPKKSDETNERVYLDPK